jgi:hypothetical protein
MRKPLQVTVGSKRDPRSTPHPASSPPARGPTANDARGVLDHIPRPMAEKITLDLKYAQDLVDFWSAKFEAGKAELAAAQVRAGTITRRRDPDACGLSGNARRTNSSRWRMSLVG